MQDDVFTTSGKNWERLKDFGRAMRKAPTEAEAVLWSELRGQKLGAKFRRQHAIDSFIVDFVSLPDKLVVEVDGKIHDDINQVEYDAGRTQILAELGYRVLRFPNQRVLRETQAVVEEITQNLRSPNANPKNNS